jgi:hypothetical protein
MTTITRMIKKRRAGRQRAGAMRDFWPVRTGAMQLSGYGLPRTPLLGTWVNKGKRQGRGC